MTPVKSEYLLGHSFNLLTQQILIDHIQKQVKAYQEQPDMKCYFIGNINLHALYLLENDPVFRNAMKCAELIQIDGMIIIFLLKLCGSPARRSHRTGALDYLPELLKYAGKARWRVCAIGGHPSDAAKIGTTLKGLIGNGEILHMDGYFSEQEEHRRIAEINRFNADLLLVGMGMPKQELFIAHNLESIRAGVALSVGGFFDQISGIQSSPPRWLGGLGLEGVYRLIRHPRRFAKRYLLEPLYLLPSLGKEIVKRRLGSFRNN